MQWTAERIALYDARTDRAARFAATVEAARGTVIVPRAVRIRDGALEWSEEAPGWDGTWSLAQYAEAGATPYTRGRIDDAVLDQFIELYRASDEQIAAFARRYGVPYVQPDGVPNGEPDEVEYPDETYQSNEPVQNPGGKGFHIGGERERPVRWCREPVKLWRDWSLIVSLLLRYGLELRDTPGRIEPERFLKVGRHASVTIDKDAKERWYWSQPRALVSQLAYTSVGPARDNAHRATTGDEQRIILGGWLDLLTDYAGLTMRLAWQATGRLQPRISRSRWEDSESLTNAPNGVFGDIIMQLVNTLLSDRQFRFCPDCGELFKRVGREHACENCRLARRNETKKNTWAKHRDAYNARRRGRPLNVPPI